LLKDSQKQGKQAKKCQKHAQNTKKRGIPSMKLGQKCRRRRRKIKITVFLGLDAQNVDTFATNTT
jgi:hypothetical protein